MSLRRNVQRQTRRNHVYTTHKWTPVGLLNGCGLGLSIFSTVTVRFVKYPDFEPLKQDDVQARKEFSEAGLNGSNTAAASRGSPQRCFRALKS